MYLLCLSFMLCRTRIPSGKHMQQTGRIILFNRYIQRTQCCTKGCILHNNNINNMTTFVVKKWTWLVTLLLSRYANEPCLFTWRFAVGRCASTSSGKHMQQTGRIISFNRYIQRTQFCTKGCVSHNNNINNMTTFVVKKWTWLITLLLTRYANEPCLFT